MSVRRVSRLLFALVAAVGLGLGVAGPALAHNQLVDSDPADLEQLETGPAEVRLEFLSSLDPENAELDVTGPGGSSVVSGGPEFDGSAVTIPIEARLAGVYQVTYDVLSTDGHWVDGTLEFGVVTGEPLATGPEPPAPEPTGPAATGPAAAGPVAGASEPEPGGGAAWWVWLLVAAALAAAGGFAFARARRRAGR